MTFEIYKGVFMNNKGEGLGLGKITMFAVGATLASGVFSLSGDFAASGAYPLAVLIGWGISGLGMLMLTLCFFRLSVVRPDLTQRAPWESFFYYAVLCFTGKFLSHIRKRH